MRRVSYLTSSSGEDVVTIIANVYLGCRFIAVLLAVAPHRRLRVAAHYTMVSNLVQTNALCGCCCSLRCCSCDLLLPQLPAHPPTFSWQWYLASCLSQQSRLSSSLSPSCTQSTPSGLVEPLWPTFTPPPSYSTNSLALCFGLRAWWCAVRRLC